MPRYAIATCDITIAMLCRQMVAGIYKHLRFNSPLMGSASHLEAEARATSLFAILLASFSQGALYWVTGYVRAAELVLFLPYPVLAGLLAVVGGMATAGAASVASGSAVTDLDSLNSALSESGPQLAAAAGLAGLSLVISSRLHFLSAFVLLVPAALIIFYAAAGFNGMSLDHLTKVRGEHAEGRGGSGCAACALGGEKGYLFLSWGRVYFWRVWRVWGLCVGWEEGYLFLPSGGVYF